MNIFNQFTLRTLKKNKTRTLVTIIGIALSVAMFTAVTSIIVSLQQYLVDVEVSSQGAWEGHLMDASNEAAERLAQDKGVRASTRVANLGYARLKDSQNENKPYLFVAGIQKNFTDFSVLTLAEGRMPKNSSELLISRHLEDNGGVKYQIGDTLELQLGKRVSAKGEDKGLEIGGQDIAYLSNQYGGETLKDTVTRKYTIVGICERPVYEDYSAPGYTAFTLDDTTEALNYDVLVDFKDPVQAENIMNKHLSDRSSWMTHNALLRYQGRSLNSNYNQVLYLMGAILISIIMIGSISLIYNAFSISVSERTKQFGLLKSIGATKKQMRQSVLFEACVLSVFGIFLGVLAGLLGIGITLHCVNGLFQRLWASGDAVDLSLTVTWQSILIAAAIGFITVLISALIPAARAVKLSPIQAIRQNVDVRIRPGEVKTSGISYRLFGFEAMLATKNFKRNRKKYRTTVFSLFISIVLFVTATSFSSYMIASIDATKEMVDYDISFSVDREFMKKNTPESIKKAMENCSQVKQTGYSKYTRAQIDLPLEYIDPDYLEMVKKTATEIIDEKKNTLRQNVAIYFVEDTTYQNYLEKAGLDVEKYMSPENGTALVWDSAYNDVDGKMVTLNMLKKAGWNGEVNFIQDKEGYYYENQSDGDVYFYEQETDKEVHFPLEDVSKTVELTMGAVGQGILPLGVNDWRWNNTLTLILPYRAIAYNQLEDVVMMNLVNYQVQSDNHKKAYQEIQHVLKEKGINEGDVGLYDRAESMEGSQALVLIINVFSYGFIILISLISVANVFNTISTNIQLRRQEFAMLKSVGMTQKGFNRMMNYECVLYGLKGLIYGIPVALGLSILMYKAMTQGWNAEYLFPWQGILISTVSVFAVVFATMLYSMRKVKKDNPIEALRNENL